MTMTRFSYWSYMIFGAGIPILFMVVTMLLTIFAIRRLARKRYSPKVIFSPILFWVLGFIIFTTSIGAWFIPPLTLTLEPNAPPQKTIGVIEEIKTASPLPVYYNRDSGSFHPAILLTVSGDEYYLPYCELEVGTQVALTWSTERRVVSSLSTDVDAETNTELSAEPQTQSGEAAQASSENTSFGISLSRISFILFVGVVLLQYLLGKRVAPWLQERDRTHRGGIVPSRIGILHFCLVFLPFFGILAGMAISGFGGALLILVLGGVVLGWILIKKQNTGLMLSGDKVVYRKVRRELAFHISDIQNVTWVQSGIPGNRRLRITLRNGAVLDFEQENFWGLEDMYRKLSKRIQEHG